MIMMMVVACKNEFDDDVENDGNGVYDDSNNECNNYSEYRATTRFLTAAGTKAAMSTEI